MNKRITAVLALIAILVMTVSTSAQIPKPQVLDLATGARAESQVYIVIMEEKPAIAYEGNIMGLPATKPGKGGKINPNSAHVKKYVKFLEKEHDKALAAVGASSSEKIYDYSIALNGFAVPLTEAQANDMARQPGVALVLPDQIRYPTTDSVATFLGLTAEEGAWEKGYTGEGVVVGILDTGIWPEHPSFADDGSYGPPPVVLDESERSACDFGNTAHNPGDAPFTCNNKLIGARQYLDIYKLYNALHTDEYDSARDDDGHGSHVASTAAGNAGVEASIFGIPRGTIAGIAPRAHVVMYKVCGGLGCYGSDGAAAVDQAVLDGVDVINYSIGGGASGPGADEIAFLFAAHAGVFVATSAGNSGPDAASVGNPGTMPWITAVGANTQSRFFQGTAILGDGSMYYGASITAGTDELPLVDAEFAGGDLCLPGTLDPAVVAGKIVLCRRGGSARADKSLAVWTAGGAGMIMYENSDDNNLFSDTHWVPSVHIDQTPGLAIKAYIAADPAAATATIVGEQYSEWPYAPSMTIFSSRGPNPVAEDIIKPDITAPGIQILAGNSPTPARSWNAYLYPGELFQAIAGTSQSSPIVAGVFALLKQVHPDWSAAMAKSAIMTTAYQDVLDNDRMSAADPFDMGAGHVNPGGEATKGSVFEPGLAYDAGLYEYAAFTCGMEWGVFTPGSCDFLKSIGVPMEPYNLNYPSIGIARLAGSQTVVRTVTSVAKEMGWREYTVSVDAPPGYEVTVEPSKLRLRSGQSATYEVTITNVEAPVGEWRFGSLTWSDKTGNYDVYSPIAVRGCLFSAPEEIAGSGEDGSASFDVTFGYTGDYAAAAHGLEPATVTSDNVVQDPDQTFDPNDGYSNLHQFTLSGAALFRIAMPPEATETGADLDIFVYAPGVVPDPYNWYASSTAGGTDELIDILLPADGTWSVYVHGWSAPGGDSDYDMYTWAISATPGGNLTIDSAPTSATLGATETIDVSWTGATAGEWHLGAISHTTQGNLNCLTLVNVDNR
jgi:subtilisin family serine protease